MDMNEMNSSPAIDDVEALRRAIFESDDLSSELVKVPEWNVEVEIRSMTGDERAHYLARMQENAPGGDMTRIDWRSLYPSLLAATVFSPARKDGEWVPGKSTAKVFRESDVDALNAKSARAIERLAKRAQALSGLNQDDDEETK